MTKIGLCSSKSTKNRKSRNSLKGLFLAIAAMAVLVIPGAAPVKAAGAPAIDVWWPTANATVSGVQPFKAMLENMNVNDYYMFWEVGTGQYNLMQSNYQDYPHKEATVDLSGWHWQSSGNYEITFIAQNLQGQEISRTSVLIHIAGSGTTAPSNTSVATTGTASTGSGTATATAPTVTAPVTNTAPAPTTAPVTVTAQTATAPATVSQASPSDIFAGAKLYVDPQSEAEQAVNTLSTYDAYDASLIEHIASQPTGVWFGGWNSNIQSDVNAVVTAAANQNAVPLLVAYNIPDRDCGGYSAGGAQSASAYAQWIRSFAAGINGRRAAVILEPDGTSATSCLSASEQQARWGMLSDAVNVLKAAGASVYIDAGHAAWVDPSTMAANLRASGIANADGFSLNVSNFFSTSDNEAYGAQISAQTGGKHFVIDTGRDGNPSVASQWCNPSGAALGVAPTANTGDPLADAFLWIKPPGESDGSCNGGPSAGTFWNSYAEQLVKDAGL